MSGCGSESDTEMVHVVNAGTETVPGARTRVVGEGLRLLSARDLMDVRVRNPQGEDLGEIKNLMVDLNAGRIVYAVLAFGGVLGAGEKLFAIPWEAFTQRTEERTFILNVDREQLEKSPGFREDEWPMHGDWELVQPAPYAAERAAVPEERVVERRETREMPMGESVGLYTPRRDVECPTYEAGRRSPEYDREWLEGMFSWFGVQPYWCE